MIVLLLITAIHKDVWATSVATYRTPDECFVALKELVPKYQKKWPDMVMWCSEPIGFEGN